MKNFKKLLDTEYRWPTVYCFKFILKESDLSQLRSLFDSHIKFVLKRSRRGKYVSVTFSLEGQSSDHIIDLYNGTKSIKSLISL